MASSDLTIDVVSWAMRLEKAKADMSSRNIASANVPGANPMRIDFSSQIDALKNILNSNVDEQSLKQILSQPFEQVATKNLSVSGGVQLDSEVADLTSAELRYKTLAEALSRKLSIHSLAASGRQ